MHNHIPQQCDFTPNCGDINIGPCMKAYLSFSFGLQLCVSSCCTSLRESFHRPHLVFLRWSWQEYPRTYSGVLKFRSACCWLKYTQTHFGHRCIHNTVNNVLVCVLQASNIVTEIRDDRFTLRIVRVFEFQALKMWEKQFEYVRGMRLFLSNLRG